MEDHILDLQPDIVLFLVGINDASIEITNRGDEAKRDGRKNKWEKLLHRSKVVSLITNLRGVQKAYNAGLIRALNFDIATRTQIELTIAAQEKFLVEHEVVVDDYASRLNLLIQTCLDNNIQPMLITQPAVFGDSVDVSTGVDLAKVEYAGINGSLMWKYLDGMINEATRQLAVRHDVLLIDLASQMEKDSKYYWDYVHFSKLGNERVAEIIYPYLKKTAEAFNSDVR